MFEALIATSGCHLSFPLGSETVRRFVPCDSPARRPSLAPQRISLLLHHVYYYDTLYFFAPARPSRRRSPASTPSMCASRRRSRCSAESEFISCFHRMNYLSSARTRTYAICVWLSHYLLYSVRRGFFPVAFSLISTVCFPPFTGCISVAIYSRKVHQFPRNGACLSICYSLFNMNLFRYFLRCGVLGGSLKRSKTVPFQQRGTRAAYGEEKRGEREGNC